MAIRSLRFSSRLALVATTLAFTASFQWSYRELVAPLQAFWGAGYRELGWLTLVAIYLACVLPSLWMPLRFSRPSLLLFYVQYYLIFIPACFVVFYNSRPRLTDADALELLVWMTLGMTVLASSYLFRTARLRFPRIKPRLYWVVVAGSGACLFGYVFLVLAQNFRLVDFTQIYNVRSDMDTIVSSTGSRFIAYATMWLAGLFFPLAFAIGIAGHKRWLVLSALAGYLFFFGVAGQKSALFAIVYLPLFYLLLKFGRERVPILFAVALAAMLLSGFIVVALLPETISIWYIALVHFRILVVQAINLVQYFAYFAIHATTHLSHITGLNFFLGYPMEFPVPIELGYYWYNAPVHNNGGFWAADAIAGFGAWAIPAVSAIAALVFWVLDSCARFLDPRFVALVLSFVALTFGNGSLATTFVSGGLGLICLALVFLPRTGRFAKSYLWR